MLVVTGLWIAAAGVVAVSLESIGVAIALFGVAALMMGWGS